MALFGEDLLKKKFVFKLERQQEAPKQTLKELAEEKFGKDRKLMMEIDAFLQQKREKHIYPSKIAWVRQLDMLEKFPEAERLAQVKRSVTNDYRALCYETNLKTYAIVEKEKEENICYDEEFEL